jgi:hypothetical protein
VHTVACGFKQYDIFDFVLCMLYTTKNLLVACDRLSVYKLHVSCITELHCVHVHV